MKTTIGDEEESDFVHVEVDSDEEGLVFVCTGGEGAYGYAALEPAQVLELIAALEAALEEVEE